jgi:hypothetical protein
MNEWIIYTLLRNTGCISLLIRRGGRLAWGHVSSHTGCRSLRSRQGGSIGMGPRQQATILRYRPSPSPTLLYPEIMGLHLPSSNPLCFMLDCMCSLSVVSAAMSYCCHTYIHTAVSPARICSSHPLRPSACFLSQASIQVQLGC